MRVLDLFSGLGGWSAAFKDRGHEVITVDMDKKFNPIIIADIMDMTYKDLEKFGKFDVILASPPCNCFSVLTIPKYWKKELGVSYPKNEKTIKAIELVKHTLDMIEILNPRFWILENPMGMLRKQYFMKKYRMVTITQCQYGREDRKPTDLWGKFPKDFKPKKCEAKGSCHIKVHRGKIKGKQSNKKWSLGGVKDKANSAYRSKLPYGLSLAVCEACEKEL